MTPRFHRSRRDQAAIATLLLALTSVAHAFDFYKADNESNLDVVAAWVDASNVTVATAPVNSTTSTDTWIWDSRVTGVGDADGINSVTVGSGKDLGVQTIRIVNPALPVSFNGNGRTFTTTGGGGIDMAAATQDLTLQNMFFRVTGGVNIGIQVATGRTLTFGSTAQINVRNTTSNGIININTDGTSAGRVIFGAAVAPSHIVVGGGHVEFNSPTGTTRIATASPNPVSYTNINGGLVLVNNTSGSATGDSIVNVNTGGTLGGAGKITGSTNSVVNANSGSTLAPGSEGIGTLSIGKLNLAAGSNIAWEATNTASADLIAVTGASGLTINGGVLHLYNPGTTNPFSGTGVFTLFTYSGAIGGTGIGALSIDPATKIEGRNYAIGLGAGTVTLSITSGTITPSYWNTDASGTWSTPGNWTGGTVPNAISAIAQITGSGGATLTAPRTITLDSARTVGVLQLESGQTVTVAGANTLTMDAAGAAASLTSIGASHVVSAPIAMTAGGILASVEDSSATLTLSGQISGTGVGIAKIGTGTLLLTADNPYTGTTTIAAGKLQLGNGGTTGSVGGPVSVTGSLKFNRSDATTQAFAISGTGNVEFAGTGATTLPLANTYSGTTTLSAGSLVLANTQALQSSTLNYSSTGGSMTIADPVTAVTLGGLSGDRAFPLTNSIGTAIALTVGANNGSTTYSGSPLGTGASLTKTGSGTFAITGTHVYSGATTVNSGVLSLDAGSTLTTTAATTPTATASGTARILVNGGTLNASAASLISNVSAGLVVAGGTANFTGGLSNETGSSSGNPFISATGGTLNASGISLSRGGLNISADPGSGQTANGLYINGGAVNVTGTLGIGALTGANSSVSARMDAGSLNVTGPVTIGINNITSTPYRWSVLDINGGTFTSTDTVSGVQLGSPFAGHVAMLIRKSSAVVNVQRIQFGQGALAGKSYLTLSAGALYVGSGGLVLGSTAPAGTDPASGQFDAALRLNGGTLGATADWSTTIPVSMGGTGAVVSGSDASNVAHTINLQGPTTGLVALTKKGSGTVIFSSPSNDIFGPTVIEAGVLKLAGMTSQPVTVNVGATFAPLGAFSVAFDDIISSTGNIINGTLAIGYNSISSPAVSSLTAVNGKIEIGASSNLIVSGTGNLPGPVYVILKAAGGVTGTFGSVSLPAGLTLNYAYDDDNDAGTPPVVALVGSTTVSPYDTWAASYSLSGNNALPSADPDGDGLVNQLEYALDTSPVASDAASAYTLGRSGNFLTLTFKHPADSTLTYAIEASNDLTGAWTVVNTFAPFTTAATVTYTDTVNITATPKRFLRLKVTPAAP